MNVLRSVKTATGMLLRLPLFRQQNDAPSVISRQLLNHQGNLNLFRLPVPPIDYLPPDVPNEAICQRLIRAYRHADTGKSADGVWESIDARCHRALIGFLRAEDVSNVARVLSQMFVDPVTSGLALGRDAYVLTKRDPYLPALDWHDKAIALGVACGVIPAQNPEQGEYGTQLRLDSVDVLRRVAEFLRIDPAPPQVGGLFGVRFASSVIPVNQLLHVYTAHRITTLAGARPYSCLEIGGGVGLLAYLAHSMGARRFCIADLPLVNVLQGYVLLSSGVAGAVRLFGEQDSPDERTISIVPDWYVEQMEPRSFDLVVNQDSMPEMAHATMRRYLTVIPKIAHGYFLSINQEAQAPAPGTDPQGWVHAACRSSAQLQLLYRAPYWLRKGYVEEVYRIAG